MRSTVIKALEEIAISFQSRPLKLLVKIRQPTATRAGAVTEKEVKALKTGKAKAATMKRSPLMMEARPVLAPTLTPTVLSAKEVTVEVPKGPQMRAPAASAIIARLFDSLPFSSRSPASSLTASKVAVVSKRLTKIRE